MSFQSKWKDLNPERQCQIFHEYNSHFPIEIRFAFADWIDSKPWFNLDLNDINDRQSANNLALGLMNEINSKASVEPGFVSIAQQVIQKYSLQPLLLFDSIKKCLITESEIFQNNISTNTITNTTTNTTDNFMEEEFSQFFVNRIQESNKKFEEINGQIYQLKILLNKIYQFNGLYRNNNLPENQFQHYFESCRKYLDNQNIMILEMLSMKDFIFDLLKEWKSVQKSSIIDGFYDNNICQIQECFSLLLSSITKVKELLIKLREYVPINSYELIAMIDETNMKIADMVTDLINDSLVIEEQPNSAPNSAAQPLIIITKAKFGAKVRLISNNSIANSMSYQTRVHVRLLNAQEVNCLNEEGIDSLISKPSFCRIENSSQPLKYDFDKKELSATFTDIKLDFESKRRTANCPVAEEKFTLLFVTKVNILNKDFTLYALSLPIVVISRYDPDALATIMWDIALSNHDKELLTVNDKTELVWSELALTLSRKFKCETGLGLSDDHLKFIYSLIPKPYPIDYNEYNYNNSEKISWEQFSKIKLSKREFTFWEWFNSIMVLTRDVLCDLWNNRLIIGFISSEDSQRILSACYDETFLLRFSETFLGSISINFVKNGQFMKLSPYNANDLKAYSLPNCIRILKAVKYLYPNIPKDEAFERYYTKIDRKQSVTPFPYTLADRLLIAKLHKEEIQIDERETIRIVELSEEEFQSYLNSL